MAAALMPSRLSDLDDHCRLGDATPFAFGVMDCSLWAADWVRQLVGVDLAAEWRGRYASERQYMRLLLDKGGLVRVVARAMARVGATPTEPPDALPGDIGIILTEKGPALAIRCQAVWKAKTGDRLSATPHASFAWRI